MLLPRGWNNTRNIYEQDFFLCLLEKLIYRQMAECIGNLEVLKGNWGFFACIK